MLVYCRSHRHIIISYYMPMVEADGLFFRPDFIVCLTILTHVRIFL